MRSLVVVRVVVSVVMRMVVRMAVRVTVRSHLSVGRWDAIQCRGWSRFAVLLYAAFRVSSRLLY